MRSPQRRYDNKCSCHIQNEGRNEGRVGQREGEMVTMKDDRDVHWLGCGAYFTMHTNMKSFIS